MLAFVKIESLFTNLEGLAKDVGGDGTLHPGADHEAGIDGLGTELGVGVLVGRTDSVDTEVVGCLEEVFVGDGSLAFGVDGVPSIVRVGGN